MLVLSLELNPFCLNVLGFQLPAFPQSEVHLCVDCRAASLYLLGSFALAHVVGFPSCYGPPFVTIYNTQRVHQLCSTLATIHIYFIITRFILI